jgi:hypothetical protein
VLNLDSNSGAVFVQALFNATVYAMQIIRGLPTFFKGGLRKTAVSC